MPIIYATQSRHAAATTFQNVGGHVSLTHMTGRFSFKASARILKRAEQHASRVSAHFQHCVSVLTQIDFWANFNSGDCRPPKAAVQRQLQWHRRQTKHRSDGPRARKVVPLWFYVFFLYSQNRNIAFKLLHISYRKSSPIKQTVFLACCAFFPHLESFGAVAQVLKVSFSFSEPITETNKMTHRLCCDYFMQVLLSFTLIPSLLIFCFDNPVQLYLLL